MLLKHDVSSTMQNAYDAVQYAYDTMQYAYDAMQYAYNFVGRDDVIVAALQYARDFMRCHCSVCIYQHTLLCYGFVSSVTSWELKMPLYYCTIPTCAFLN